MRMLRLSCEHPVGPEGDIVSLVSFIALEFRVPSKPSKSGESPAGSRMLCWLS